MRILIAHNHYRQFGGEDAVVKTECELLRKHGEEVHLYEQGNAEINSFSIFEKAKLLLSLGWSQKSYRGIKKIIQEFKPDVVHFHNIFFLFSPSVYSACRDGGVPVIHSLHNFRLLCSNGLYFRGKNVCEECSQHSFWRGVYHRCYYNSPLISAAVARMLKYHWDKGTWINMVHRYITASEFGRQKFISAGIPGNKIVVKPNFVDIPFSKSGKDKGYVLYVGRLSEEKGLCVLLKAWESIKNIPLKILGDGPLVEELKAQVKEKNLHQVEFLGYVSDTECVEYMKGAKFLVVPSLCYENFPRTIAEALAYGIPILASRIGSIVETVQEGKTGLLFDPQSPNDLVEKANWMLSHNEELTGMRGKARQEYEKKYTSELNYSLLKSIYIEAIVTQQEQPNPETRKRLY